MLEENETLADLFEEMMESFYPQVIKLNKRIALDMGFLYIFRQLDDDDDKEVLLNFWRINSPPEIIQLPMGEFYYRPFSEFVYLDKIMNGLFIETALEQMQKFDNLTFNESCAILFDLERYFVVPLSEMDVKIIETIREFLYKRNEYNNDILSKALDVRSNYISRRIGYLRNNAYFRITGTVNYPKIGLILYIILLESSPEHHESIPQYFSSPYTRTIRRCPNQRFNYIISLTLPKEYESDLYDYLLNLNEIGVVNSYYCDEVQTLSNNLDFTYYTYAKRPSVLSASKPGFFIDWFKERVASMSLENSNPDPDFFHRFKFNGEKTNFSIMDLKVLTLYRRDLDSSVRTIARRLDLTWDDTNLHIAKMKNHLFPTVLLYYMGLNQTAIFFFDKITSKQLKLLETTFARIPQTFSYTFKNGGAIVTFDLMNGAHRLNDLVCETIPDLRNAQFSLASKTSGIFRPIPYKYYNETNKEWFFPSDFFLFNEL
ncbi:MAG: hypothetical protein FK733_03720 [Asgard group archaeon]|nr:hypothetical protein [Asgard group archaeon]